MLHGIPFVSSAQYGFTLLRRYESQGVLITGAITDGQGNPVPGVTLEGLPSAPQTDENGYYGEVVDSGWSGTVTPVLTGYTFTPASREYTNVTQDQTDQNFSAVPIAVNLIDDDQVTQDQVNTGDTITQQAAQANPGLDLVPAATDETGLNFVLDHPLVRETDGKYKTAFDLIKDEVDAFLTETTTQSNPDQTGHVSITADALGNYFVPGTISSIVTTDQADSLEFTAQGGLSIVRSGVAFSLAPAPVNQGAFVAGLSKAGLSGTVDATGVVMTTLANGSQMAFRFNWFAHNHDLSSLFSDAATSFTLQAVDPASHVYKVLVSYPDGSSQTIAPSVHDIPQLSGWLDGLGLSYRFQNNGALDLLGEAGKTIWRLIPDMAVRTADPDVSGIRVTAAGDLDENGLNDFEVKTQNGSQYLFSIPTGE